MEKVNLFFFLLGVMDTDSLTNISNHCFFSNYI